jgi:hypothetical protein
MASPVSASPVPASPPAETPAPAVAPLPATATAASSLLSSPLAHHSSPLASPGDLIIVEDDGASAATVVPGRHFRRLFTSLEAGAPRALHG